MEDISGKEKTWYKGVGMKSMLRLRNQELSRCLDPKRRVKLQALMGRQAGAGARRLLWVFIKRRGHRPID